MRKTPWYPGTVEPVHRGLYERKFSGGITFYMWDGKTWMFQLGQRKNRVWVRSMYQLETERILWRGVLK